ncbi:triose-phosphate isomerase [Thermatribacter velox]|uniref:Triosephosphate isomerase n=1 Tax=Thermatribacter velox TaxID=3039681 RepID=A0ABZ2Y8C7_9BACT
MRIPIAAGNWKMNKTVAEASAYAEALLQELDTPGVEVIICPPFTSLYALSQKFAGSSVKLGAQNMHWELKGAFTGEISGSMLLELGCEYVILGHSERRHIFRETAEEVGKKVETALKLGLRPILCVGETLEERERGETEAILAYQLEKGIEGITTFPNVESIVIAYEPVWAIGTGKAATPQDAQEAIAFVRGKLSEQFGSEKAQQIRILYGGSVSPENVGQFVNQEDIDGTLVGGASLDAGKFLDIIKETARISGGI